MACEEGIDMICISTYKTSNQSFDSNLECMRRAVSINQGGIKYRESFQVVINLDDDIMNECSVQMINKSIRRPNTHNPKKRSINKQLRRYGR